MNTDNTNTQQYIEQTSVIINLPIDPKFMPGVVDNLTRIANIAALFTEFELSENIEAAPIFKP
ncbi:DUF4089 domain-containing protein [Crocosphaera sp. Alani8]|uniref:DUF4089 domain-containing protein n=1 Tax=Crocosphaera sp. Alani8 TaxID=3038952 RepID=UPI00313BEEE8